MHFSVVVFPGSNCDRDCYRAASEVLGASVDYVRHTAEELPATDCVILPGGFSYGDYLRAGAAAAHTPVMDAVTDFARGGGLVLGICNGFQILCEAGLLPGALMVNDHLRFCCRYCWVRVEDTGTPFTGECEEGQVLHLPVAHQQGNYRPDPDGEPPRVLMRYCGSAGELAPEHNPNGSWEAIAAVSNRAGNVAGMMPHPERCCEAVLGETDGAAIFRSILNSWEEDSRVSRLR
ncbi:MAG: phosphoribosylformylglycinamidine synthase subunit PurQ [Bacillota bacterium]